MARYRDKAKGIEVEAGRWLPGAIVRGVASEPDDACRVTSGGLVYRREPRTYVQGPDGRHFLEPGDWVVWPTGWSVTVVRAADFEGRYEPIGGVGHAEGLEGR